MERILSLRKKIDKIDEQTLHLLKERVEVCKTIGVTKRKHGIPIKDSSRESELYKHIAEKATELGLNPRQVEAVYREIIGMCIHVQE